MPKRVNSLRYDSHDEYDSESSLAAKRKCTQKPALNDPGLLRSVYSYVQEELGDGDAYQDDEQDEDRHELQHLEQGKISMSIEEEESTIKVRDVSQDDTVHVAHSPSPYAHDEDVKTSHLTGQSGDQEKPAEEKGTSGVGKGKPHLHNISGERG